MIDKIINKTKEKMNYCIQTFKKHINNVRTGRASPELLSGIYVEYFGKNVPICHVANIIVEDFRTLKINVFDESITSAIRKSILNSKLDLNPVLYGKDIRVPLPSLTEERRKKIIKVIKSDAENSRVIIRNIRRESNDQAKKFLKNKIINEDEERILQAEIQKITNTSIKQIDAIFLEKEKDLMHF